MIVIYIYSVHYLYSDIYYNLLSMDPLQLIIHDDSSDIEYSSENSVLGFSSITN
jgi:hypothetical protein